MGGIMIDKEIIEKDKEIIAKRIITGLRYCEVEYPPCAHCPYRISGLNLCKKHLIGDAYYLVKTQQKEIERLSKNQADIDNFARDICKERMLKGKKIADFDDLQQYIQKEKAEAIKEFAEKLKEFKYLQYEGEVVSVKNIDNLVKEKVGAEE